MLTFFDRKRTPYTEAVLSEVQRYNTPIPLGVFHTCRSGDFNIRDYTFSPGTPVIPNLGGIHRDPTVWKNPNEFDPANFLQEGRVINQDRLIPFSIGKSMLDYHGFDQFDFNIP